MNGAMLGQYIPAESPLHALDPRCKIIMTVIVMCGVFMSKTLPSLAVWALLLPLVAHLSKIPSRAVLRSARPIVILVIFTSFLHIFWTPGREIASIGFLTVTHEGVMMAIRMGARLLFLVLYAGMLTLTTSPSELSDGLESMMSPLSRFGVPSNEIAMMITIALRFIPTLFEETDRILKAQKSRGADFDSGGLIKRAKAYIPVLIPLFVLAFGRADTLATAMEARCYRNGRGRVRMYPLKWGRRESAALTLTILITAAIVIAGRM